MKIPSVNTPNIAPPLAPLKLSVALKFHKDKNEWNNQVRLKAVLKYLRLE